MPWSIDNPPNPIKNKSKGAIKAGVEAANDAYARGLSESDCIFAAIAAASNYEQKHQVKKEVKPQTPQHTPQHILAVIEAANIAKQQKLQEELDFKQKVLEAVQDIEFEDTSNNVKQLYFDTKGKLVLEFEDGSKIASKNAVPEEVISQYIQVAPKEVSLKALEPMTILNASGDPEIVFYSDGEIVTTIVTIEE